jgi:peptide-methionine (S)-S-oxide reductase
MSDSTHEVATLAGGCFWCLEAPLRQLDGVSEVVSGYMGGHTTNPDYKQVCTGSTGHAEVVRVYYDPGKISYPDLLEVFFTLHDPTTLNRQGNDVGTQYRSAIFYHNDAQRDAACALIRQLMGERVWELPVVTEVVPVSTFYPAEDYHQHYFERNPNQLYCMAVIAPKLAKLRQRFIDRLRKMD